MPQLTAMDSGMSMPPKMGRVNAVSTLSSSFKAAVSSFIIPPPLASGAACAPGWLYVLNLSDKKRTKEKNRKGGNGEIELTCQRHLHLLFIQKRAILFEQLPDRGVLLCLHPVVVKEARRVKALAGVHRQQLDARLRAECILERTDLRADCARGKHADVCGLDDVKNKIARVGRNAVVRDFLNAHELLGGLPTLVFLLFFHVGSSHSKICCSVM